MCAQPCLFPGPGVLWGHIICDVLSVAALSWQCFLSHLPQGQSCLFCVRAYPPNLIDVPRLEYFSIYSDFSPDL